MPSAFTTCTATSMSGSRTPFTNTMARQRIVRRGWMAILMGVSSAAVTSKVSHGISARPAAGGSTPADGTAFLVSGWPER
jgi:hypothetical protein